MKLKVDNLGCGNSELTAGSIRGRRVSLLLRSRRVSLQEGSLLGIHSRRISLLKQEGFTTKVGGFSLQERFTALKSVSQQEGFTTRRRRPSGWVSTAGGIAKNVF